MKCFVIYPFQRRNNLAASLQRKFFFRSKLYNYYFSPSDIPSNNENNKFHQDIQQLFAVPYPRVVLQLQVSQSTGQDLVACQVHPADLPRKFQQYFKFDTPSSLIQQEKPPASWAQVHPGTGSSFVYVEVKITPVETFRGSFSKEIVVM